MSPTLRKKVTFWNAGEVTRLAEHETPPNSGWAVGSSGAYEDGRLVSRIAELKLGDAGGAGDDLDHTPTEILIFEDGSIPEVEQLKSSRVEGFTDRGRRVVSIANQEAHQICWPYIGSEHLLLGILREDENLAARVLSAVGVDLEAARGQMFRHISFVEGAEPTDDRLALPFTLVAANVVLGARRRASQHGESLVGPEHLLLAMIDNEGLARLMLHELGVDLEEVAWRLKSLIS
jgi:Clp amino terminal domain, pathogenicity island component